MKFKFFCFAFLLLLMNKPLLAESCSSDPKKCTLADLCEKATKNFNGQFYWIADLQSPYLRLARKLNLHCGALAAISGCERDASNCSPKDLCTTATTLKGKTTIWNSQWPEHIELAISVGMNCKVNGLNEDVEVTVPNEKPLATKLTCDSDIVACSKEDLCAVATFRPFNQNTYIWKVGRYVDFVEEAKRRGLSCGVWDFIVQPVPYLCSQYAEACDDNRLCKLAVVNESWQTDSDFQKYVIEAKRRSLKCNVSPLIYNRAFTLRKCNKHLKNCSNDKLCEIASYRPLNSRFRYQNWKLGSNYNHFRKEAKARGLTCGVGENAPKPLLTVKKNMLHDDVMLLLTKVPAEDLEHIDVFLLMQHPACAYGMPFINCFGENTFLKGDWELSPDEIFHLGFHWADRVWEGFKFTNNEYSGYYSAGNYFPTPSCGQTNSSPDWNDWYFCKTGDKYRALEGNPENKGQHATYELTLSNGAMESVQAKQGRFEYIWQNGARYVGEYKNNKQNGLGTYVNSHGDTYIGEFRDDQKNGLGTYTFASGIKYVGEFSDNKMTGYGALFSDREGGKYLGELVDGLPNGKGVFIDLDGNKYVGEFTHFQKHGKGIQHFKDGRTQEGIWVDGSFRFSQKVSPFHLPDCRSHKKEDWTNCLASTVLPSGGDFVGEYKDGKANGQGTVTYPNGNKYIGELKVGRIDGEGTYTWPNGHQFVGQFKNGEFHGNGIYEYANGDKYDGEWKNDKWHGQGNFTYADGTVKKVFIGGDKVSAKSQTMIYPVRGKITRQYNEGENEGIDIAGKAGGTVYAVADGEIAATTLYGDEIPIIVIKHADGLLTVYANIHEFKVAKGDKVTEGQEIAKLSLKAPSTMHFEIRKGMDSYDPMQYLKILFNE